MSLRSLAVTMLTALAAAGPVQAQDAEPKRGGVAVFAIPSDPNLLLRNASSQTVDGAAGCIVYEGLMGSDVEGEPVPLLAESYQISDDGKIYTFTLRDALFHDRTPVTAEDVRFTLVDVSSVHSTIFGRVTPFIEAVEAPDDKTVVIRLTEAYSPLLNALTCLQGAGILPKHVFGEGDLMTNPAMSAPVGTGAFRLAEWVRGSHLRYEAFEDYWDPELPYLDGLIAQVIPTSAGRVAALMSGEIDRIAEMGLDVSSYPMIQGNPDTELMVNHEPPGATQLFLNMEREPFDDLNVRKALFMAIDRDYILEAAFGNNGEVAKMPFPMGLDWAADQAIDFTQMYPYDVEAAKVLLDEAGPGPGANGVRFTVDLVYQSTFPGGGEIAAALDNMWGAIGVEVNVSALESATAIERVYVDGNFDAFFINYSSMGHPALGVARTFISSSVGVPAGNGSRYVNPEVDDLFAKAVRAPSLEESGALYAEVQGILAEDIPVLNLVTKTTYDAQRTDLRGMQEEYNHATWRRAWLDR